MTPDSMLDFQVQGFFNIRLKALRNRHKINWRFIASEFFRGEHAGSPLRAYVVGANLRVRPLTTLKIYKTGSYFVTIPNLNQKRLSRATIPDYFNEVYPPFWNK